MIKSSISTTFSAWRQPLIAALLLGVGLISPSYADDDPSSRVARISYLKGEVYLETDDDGQVQARINRPLTSGDTLWTDRQARSELQMGSTTLQIDQDSSVRLLELSDDVLQVQLTQGVVNLRVRALSKDDTVEIDTPNAAITALEPGNYRIEVADNDDVTVLQVRDGSLDVDAERQSYTLETNEQLTLRGSRRLAAEFDDLPRMDNFDRWAQERNQRAEQVASSRYVSSEVIGYEDLDDYGYWRWYNDYGYVWMPTRVASGWAPYRYGHWAWVSPWGWTWMDDAPWGFAPFHYGRWASISNRWCWIPGPRTVRPVYAPALVAWIGTPGISVSINLGRQPVGWIPLGPREIFRPVYRTSHNYVVNVNISNSQLSNSEFERNLRRQPQEVDYRNRQAASVVNADAMRNARPVNGQLLRTDARQLQPLNTDSTTDILARPERNNRSDDARSAASQVPGSNRAVVARRQPITPASTESTGKKYEGLRVLEAGSARRAMTERGEMQRNAERGSDSANGAGSATPAPEVRTPAATRNGSNGNDRNTERNIERGTNEPAPGSRSTRSIITTPYIRPEVKSPQRDEQQLRTPQVETPRTNAPVPRNGGARDSITDERRNIPEHVERDQRTVPTPERATPAPSTPVNPPVSNNAPAATQAPQTKDQDEEVNRRRRMQER